MIDPDHPFYRPLWVRLSLCAICLGWAGFELYAGSLAFAFIFGAMGLYATLRFFWHPTKRD